MDLLAITYDEMQRQTAESIAHVLAKRSGYGFGSILINTNAREAAILASEARCHRQISIIHASMRKALS